MVDGFRDAGNALRRILFGYDMKRPEDKAAKENLEKAASTPTTEIVTGVSSGEMKSVLMLVGVIILVVLTIKD